MGRPVNSQVRHGMASCRRYGCDRPECRNASMRAGKKSRIDRSRGITGTVDAGPATAYGKQLVEAGMPLADIATKTGLSVTTVASVVSGRVDHIYRDTQEAILAVPMPGKEYTPEADGLIEAVGAQRKIQALSRRGFSLPVLAKETGLSTETIGSVRSGRRMWVRVSADRSITAAYRRLWNANPEDFGLTASDVAKVKSWAVKQNWAPPAAWNDEEIRDPKARPRGLIQAEVAS